MPATKAQQQAQNRWIEKKFDRINLLVPKGQKQVIQEAAKARGESVNAFIVRAVERELERTSDN